MLHKTFRVQIAATYRYIFNNFVYKYDKRKYVLGKMPYKEDDIYPFKYKLFQNVKQNIDLCAMHRFPTKAAAALLSGTPYVGV